MNGDDQREEPESRGTTQPLSRQDVEAIAQSVLKSKLDTWRRMAAVFLAGFGAFIVLGISWADLRYFVLEKIYPPDVAYERLKKSLLTDSDMKTAVATDLLGLLGERVDSGYSKTLYFGPRQVPQPTQDLLEFYALPNQTVELSIIAVGPKSTQLVMTVDNTDAFRKQNLPNPTLPYEIFQANITDYLDFKPPSPLDPDAEKKQKQRFIHALRVDPVGLGENDEATFEILVLVRNEKAA